MRLFTCIHSILRTFPPGRTVYLAMDGPAPIAKFVMQRRRRTQREAKKDESEFDTLQFTPGSEFMQKLKDALVYLSVQRLAKQKPQLQFHISGSDRQGEGELKIFEHIAATPKSDRCLVVGNDADLIVFAMRAGHGQVDVLKIERDSRAVVLSASKFKDAVTNSCPHMEQNQLLSDLAFISVLSGNDYLPKLRGFNLERVWDAYLDARAKNLFAPEVPLYDSSTRTINAEFLAHLLQPKYQTTSVPEFKESRNARSALTTMLQKFAHGAEVLREEVTTANGVTSRVFVDKVLLAEAEAPTLRSARNLAAQAALGIKEESEEPPADSPLFKLLAERVPDLNAKTYLSWLKRFLPSEEELNAPPPTEEVVRTSVAEFLKGVVWVMEYLGGSCHDYGYRYTPSFAPSVVHVRKHVREVPLSFTFKSDAQPLAPLPFFLALMPPNSEDALKFVPAEYKHLLAPDSPLADLYHGDEADMRWLQEPERCIERIKQAVDAVPAAHTLLRFQPALMLERSSAPPTKRPARGAVPQPYLISRSPVAKFTPLATHDIERIACYLEKPLLATATTTTATSSTTATNPRRPPGLPLAFIREYRSRRLAGLLSVGGPTTTVRPSLAAAAAAGVSSSTTGVLASSNGPRHMSAWPAMHPFVHSTTTIRRTWMSAGLRPTVCLSNLTRIKTIL